MGPEQIAAVEQCLKVLTSLSDGDECYEVLANVCFNLFVRAGWEANWPAFAAQVERGMAQRHLMDEPGGSA